MKTRSLGVALIGMAAALAALALLGPLVTGTIEWRTRPLVLNQLYGLDAVSLALVAPLALTAGVLALRGDRIGALLGFPPAAYAVYMVPQYVLGPDYAHLPGNNERWFPLLLALFALGVVASALAWSALTPPPPDERRERIVATRLLPLAAFVVFVRYVPALADWMSAAPSAEDYVAGPNFAWTIALLDLGVVLPATVAVIAGHRRRASWGRRGLYALTGWFALVGTAVAGMALAMQLRDDPAMTPPQLALMLVLGAVLVAQAAVLYAPAVARSGGPGTMAGPRD